MRELRNAACEAAARGWSVFPLRPRDKRPFAGSRGKDDSTTDLATVLSWWLRYPTANLAVHCRASGLLCVDVDPRHGGDETFVDLEHELGPLPATVEAQTGGGGWHYYFQHPGGEVVGKLGRGVDLKDHGYCLLSPSTHPNGTRYEWSVDGHPDEVAVASLPERWIKTIRTNVPSSARPARTLDHDDPLRSIPAATYIYRLTGREVNRFGFVRCPFHAEGEERTPSLKVSGELWACHACDPLGGKRAMGGNLFDLAGLLWGFPVPLRGADYSEVRGRLERMFK